MNRFLHFVEPTGLWLCTIISMVERVITTAMLGRCDKLMEFLQYDYFQLYFKISMYHSVYCLQILPGHTNFLSSSWWHSATTRALCLFFTLGAITYTTLQIILPLAYLFDHWFLIFSDQMQCTLTLPSICHPSNLPPSGTWEEVGMTR